MSRFSLNRQHIAPQLLLRSWPFPRGSGRLTDRLFSKLPMPGDAQIVRTTDGFNLMVQPADLIGRHLYLTGEFDRSNFEVLNKFSFPGDTLLDVGANVGYVSACFLWNVVASRVIAIEPQPAVGEFLAANLRHFGPDRHHIVLAALSNSDGVASFQICDYNKGESKIVAQSGADTIEVKLYSAQRLLSEIEPQRLDLIKIDVEGHEEQVLSGLLPALNEGLQPRAILYEDHRRLSGVDGSIGLLLRARGYRVFGIKKRLTKLELLPIRVASDCRFSDYLAVNGSKPIPERALRAYPALAN